MRGFCNASGRLHCYDKAAEKYYPTSTEAAAQEQYFYEIPPGSFGDVNIPVNAIEDALGAVEGTWAPLHSALIHAAASGRIPAALTVDYAPFLVMQWMRTRTYRDAIYQIAAKTMQKFVDELIAVNFPGHSATIKVDEKAMPAMHSEKLFEPGTVERMADEIGRHYWVVGINDTDRLFYTSDHPVVRRGNLTHEGRPLVGILDPGVEFVFPLDSRHNLIILERTHFADWRQHDNKAIPLSDSQVRDYNDLQVRRSSQRVFCAENDFDLARTVCVAHPEVCDPNRARVIVEATPIKDLKNQILVTALE